VHTLRAASMLALFSTKAFKRPCRSLKACPSSHTSCKPVNNNYQAGLQSMSAISIMTEGSIVGMQGRSSAQCALCSAGKYEPCCLHCRMAHTYQQNMHASSEGLHAVKEGACVKAQAALCLKFISICQHLQCPIFSGDAYARKHTHNRQDVLSSN